MCVESFNQYPPRERFAIRGIKQAATVDLIYEIVKKEI